MSSSCWKKSYIHLHNLIFRSNQLGKQIFSKAFCASTRHTTNGRHVGRQLGECFETFETRWLHSWLNDWDYTRTETHPTGQLFFSILSYLHKIVHPICQYGWDNFFSHTFVSKYYCYVNSAAYRNPSNASQCQLARQANMANQPNLIGG